jgi:nucleoside-triphosphatase
LLLTGSPGVGKSTVLMRTVGYVVSGMLSCEVRSCGARVGFEILDLGSDRRGWLAHLNQKSGPRVGRYCVNMQDLNNIGAEAITRAAEHSDVVAIDEIGPMELYSEKFKEAVRKAVKSNKVIVGIVHWKAKDTLLDEVKKREDAETIIVTEENRNKLHEAILEKVIVFFGVK